MKPLLAATLVLAIVAAAAFARADDKPNPTGTWKWTERSDGVTRAMTLRLRLEGDKLTGTTVGRDGREHYIQDAAYQDGEVSFKAVTRVWRGGTITATYTGKVSGDTIKGKWRPDGGGGRSQDWDAKRASN
jgi:hypothetical protein